MQRLSAEADQLKSALHLAIAAVERLQAILDEPPEARVHQLGLFDSSAYKVDPWFRDEVIGGSFAEQGGPSEVPAATFGGDGDGPAD